MPFDWKEYLELAKSLQNNQGNGYSQEATFRSAISRAYYGAFCHARNFIRDYENYFPQNNASDHFHVKEHLRQYGRINIARKLEKLRRWQNNCDYKDIIGKDLTPIVGEAIQYAQDIIDQLK
ncbi:MAG: hypothetical protein AAB116_13145 [Candidatus Poribacteria bacterium]